MSNPATVNLNKDVYTEGYPDRDEGIWNHIGQKDFKDALFKIRTINPVEWFTKVFNGSQTPKEVFEDHAEKWQKQLVKRYRKIAKELNANRFIVVDGDILVDGWHRMVAFALEGITEARAVDLTLFDE